MKRVIALFLTLTMLLAMCGCGKKATEPVDLIDETAAVENDIQGTWKYYDASIGFNEELSFRKGSFTYTSYMDAAPDNAHSNYGNYRIEDGKICLTFSNGKSSYLDYRYEGETIVVSFYMDSGGDKGNNRILNKQS